MSARLRLRDRAGATFLDHWEFEWPAPSAREPIRSLGIFLHRMHAPGPGLDLHDHPWTFASVVLWGGYDEERSSTAEAPTHARQAELQPASRQRGATVSRRWLSMRSLGVGECHQITRLHTKACWTVVIHGPNRHGWGFYASEGFVSWREYEASAAGARRGATTDIASTGRTLR